MHREAYLKAWVKGEVKPYPITADHDTEGGAR